jgi:hypothetical protein
MELYGQPGIKNGALKSREASHVTTYCNNVGAVIVQNLHLFSLRNYMKYIKIRSCKIKALWVHQQEVFHEKTFFYLSISNINNCNGTVFM